MSKITIDRAVLEQALDALVTINDAIYVSSNQEADAVYKTSDAIARLRKSLAQPEQESVAYMHEGPP